MASEASEPVSDCGERYMYMYLYVVLYMRLLVWLGRGREDGVKRNGERGRTSRLYRYRGLLYGITNYRDYVRYCGCVRVLDVCLCLSFVCREEKTREKEIGVCVCAVCTDGYCEFSGKYAGVFYWESRMQEKISKARYTFLVCTACFFSSNLRDTPFFFCSLLSFGPIQALCIGNETT